MSLGEISQAVIEALAALFNGIADYSIPWDDGPVLIGFFAAVFVYILFNALIAYPRR
jgi:F0F1-type ATP synthase membrane subunit a